MDGSRRYLRTLALSLLIGALSAGGAVVLFLGLEVGSHVCQGLGMGVSHPRPAGEVFALPGQAPANVRWWAVLLLPGLGGLLGGLCAGLVALLCVRNPRGRARVPASDGGHVDRLTSLGGGPASGRGVSDACVAENGDHIADGRQRRLWRRCSCSRPPGTAVCRSWTGRTAAGCWGTSSTRILWRRTYARLLTARLAEASQTER